MKIDKQTKNQIKKEILTKFPLDEIDKYVIASDEIPRYHCYPRNAYFADVFVLFFIGCFFFIYIVNPFELVRFTVDETVVEYGSIKYKLLIFFLYGTISFFISLMLTVPLDIFLSNFLPKCPKCQNFNMYHGITVITDIKLDDINSIRYIGHAFVCRNQDCGNKIFELEKCNVVECCC